MLEQVAPLVALTFSMQFADFLLQQPYVLGWRKSFSNIFNVVGLSIMLLLLVIDLRIDWSSLPFFSVGIIIIGFCALHTKLMIRGLAPHIS